MSKLLSTLFSSKESYFARQLSNNNEIRSFPARSRIDSNELISSIYSDSILVSGGSDEERSVFLLGLMKINTGCTIIIHNGNKYFDVERVRNYGISATNWDENIYSGLTKRQILSILIGNKDDEELAVFYSFALEVCEMLNLPLSIESLYSIDWLGIEWQKELLNVSGKRDEALDLLNRFDKSMAEKAVKGVCKLERIIRTNGEIGVGINEAIDNEGIIIKEVSGSQSSVCKQCMEIVEAKAEEGKEFTIILDDVYLDSSIIKDNYRNVRLILSGADITQYKEDFKITNRPCSVVVFNHANYKSCKTISETYFGEYEKLDMESSRGQSKTIFAPKTTNKTMTVRHSRDARLKPELIASIPYGIAFVRTIAGLEGYISLA